MATKKSERAGGNPLARPTTEAPATRVNPHVGAESLEQETLREETKLMPSYGTRTQTQSEGVTVIGEAVRRTLSESAEVIIEITSAAPTAAQALRDNQTKTMQISQSVSPLGVQQGDVQPISQKVQSLYSAGVPAF